ncbi:MAG: proton-conducting transporter membrane subunit, partial [Eubacteriales bacterium]|nr:proton-conducting transporter membrane subunit [Eubacteriales bacterium]
MSLFQPDNLIQLSILLFFGAAAASILLRKRDALCNRISNIICIGAALILAWASLVIISGGHGPVDINLFKSTLPFIELNMRVDALSAVFLLILAILTICVSIYSIGYISHYYGKRNVGLFYLLYITFILSMVFVFTSSNAIFFYIAWEAMAVLSYFLVIFESEHEENIRAGTLYVVMTHIATAFLL